MKQVFLIGGANGAGKTTSAKMLLSGKLDFNEYVNADNIALGISPFNPDTASIQAGKVMFERINSLINQNKSFAFETTCASKIFAKILDKCKENGYVVNIVFLWLPSFDLAIDRVRLRVLQGGHNIPTNVIKRRYKSGIVNLFDLYIPRADNLYIYNVSDNKHEIIAKKVSEKEMEIFDEASFKTLRNVGSKNE